jgi:hypothetical protein
LVESVGDAAKEQYADVRRKLFDLYSSVESLDVFDFEEYRLPIDTSAVEFFASKFTKDYINQWGNAVELEMLEKIRQVHNENYQGGVFQEVPQLPEIALQLPEEEKEFNPDDFLNK